MYDDDWFADFRLGLNDTRDTAILGGAVVDGNRALAVVEAERRMGEAWKAPLSGDR